MAEIDHTPAESKFLSVPKLPLPITVVVTVICVAPLLFNLIGLDFGTEERPLDPNLAVGMNSEDLTDAMFYALSGSFVHTILEWSAFYSAIFTVILSFCLFYIQRNISVPVIGMALFSAGCLDAFHTLAADRLIEATAPNQNLIPFTWAISRLFDALIMLVGVGILIFQGKKTFKGSIYFVLGIGIFFAFLAYGVISYCATSNLLPETQFPDYVLTRPWDIIPLVLYLVGFVFVYPKYYKLDPGFFSHSVIISCIPNISTQLYMAFGSSALFDNNFNVAHFTKILAYLIPFVGLSLEFVRSLYNETRTSAKIKFTKDQIIEERTVELQTILGSLVDPLITIDEMGVIYSFSTAAERVFGYSEKEVIGQNVRILMPEPYHGEHDRYLSNYRKTGKAKMIGTGREVMGRRKDGSVFPLELGVSEMQLDNRRMYIGICRDITERKMAEQELAASQAVLEKQNWFKTGLAELHEKMRGEQDELTLSQNIINYLANRLDMQVGAVYLYRKGEMQFVAGYAYNEIMQLAKRYLQGGGLVSQAALEKKSILVTDLPEDYIRIQSGFIDAPPKNVMVIPILYEGEVIGVLELASLNEISEDYREFLDLAVETIAVSLNTSRSRTHLIKLLESKLNME